MSPVVPTNPTRMKKKLTIFPIQEIHFTLCSMGCAESYVVNKVKGCFGDLFWGLLMSLLLSSALLFEGARRFVTLDFGRPILLTDVLIPTCGDLASLSIDIWTLGEEVDGRRLVVATDISTHSLILHDLIPPPVCRFMKVKIL